MLVKRCTVNGQPGVQAKLPDGRTSTCHAYDPDDTLSIARAMRDAGREAEQAVAEQVAEPGIG